MKKVKIKKINNLITFDQSSEIKNVLFHPEFPFGCLDNVTYPDSELKTFILNNKDQFDEIDPNIQYGFFHMIYGDDQILSPFYETVAPILESFKEKMSIKIKKLIRIRIRMTTKVSVKSIKNYPHVDGKDPHKVLIYYVNDSDGDTFFYKKNNNNFEEALKITPSMGSGVYFDGSIYHASSTPSNVSRRMTINFNFQ